MTSTCNHCGGDVLPLDEQNGPRNQRGVQATPWGTVQVYGDCSECGTYQMIEERPMTDQEREENADLLSRFAHLKKG